jgi:hypothetical protein
MAECAEGQSVDGSREMTLRLIFLALIAAFVILAVGDADALYERYLRRRSSPNQKNGPNQENWP